VVLGLLEKTDMRFRLMFFISAGAATQAFAALLVRSFIYVEGFFPSHLIFFSLMFCAILGLMMISLFLSIIIERVFVINCWCSHAITAITFTLLLIAYQFWAVQSTLLHLVYKPINYET
jgi:hypothetical protein